MTTGKIVLITVPYDQVCTVDTTIASWLAGRHTRQPASLAVAADWLRRALGSLLPKRTGAAR